MEDGLKPLVQGGAELHVKGTARRDIAAIVRWSVRNFGEDAARRYEALLLQALADIAGDAEQAGSKGVRA